MGKFTVIRTEGGSRVLTVTTFLPKEWKFVEIEAIKTKDNSVTLKIDKVK